MFQLKQFYLMEEEGGDGGNGGGGSGPEITPEVQKLIDAAVNTAVGGLKTKNSELLGKLRESGDKLKSFDGIDPESVRSILQRFSDDEEAKLIASGKIDEVLNKRTERMKQSYEKETLTERQARESAEQRASKFERRVLENGIRAAAASAGIFPHAIDDALLRAGQVFLLDEDGNPAASDGIYGKDGKPLTLQEWFAEMKDKAPHWFPAASGGGASGSGKQTDSKTLTRSRFDAMNAFDKAAFMRAGGKLTDD
jgi:hypothetical protein